METLNPYTYWWSNGIQNLHQFFVGVHQLRDAKHFNSCMVSINRLNRYDRLRERFMVHTWMLDSAAFTELKIFGRHRRSPREYAAMIRVVKQNGRLLAAVAQDYMCEAFMLKRTGLSVKLHQELTIQRYDDLLDADPQVYILPVLQGFTPDQYLRHLDRYGDRLKPGMWVGVGSVCKRNGDPQQIVDVLRPIKRERPDLLLHGFGIKKTSLSDDRVRHLLWTCDSLAWSYAARYQGRDQNDWREAEAMVRELRPYVGYDRKTIQFGGNHENHVDHYSHWYDGKSR